MRKKVQVQEKGELTITTSADEIHYRFKEVISSW
jgi:hypothetical protein